MFDYLRWQRRPLVIAAALLIGLLVLLGLVAVAARLSGADGSQPGPAALRPRGASTAPDAPVAPAPGQMGPGASSVVSASPAADVASWDHIRSVKPATSPAYPAITGTAARDPSAFAAEFVTELLTRDYRATSRAQLLAWAQFEDAPLPSPHYPRADWSKVLTDSLTDPGWDGAVDTPIPADGPWLALRSERARDVVSAVRIVPDPRWQAKIAGGWQPPDPLAGELDASATVTEHAVTGGRPHVARYSVSLIVQLGTSPHGGYGVAATNNFVSRKEAG